MDIKGIELGDSTLYAIAIEIDNIRIWDDYGLTHGYFKSRWVKNKRR